MTDVVSTYVAGNFHRFTTGWKIMPYTNDVRKLLYSPITGLC